MRISTIYGFAFLCMPKCASTSIEAALTPYCDLITKKGTTSLKHTNYRQYSEYIEPYLDRVEGVKPETVCLMREPIDWLHSWYRYRKREKMRGKPRSTADMSFSKFCELYLEGKIKLGGQFNFLKNENGEVGMDRIFRYERLDIVQKYFENKIGEKIVLPVYNVSPKEVLELDDSIEKRLRELFREDYEVYLSLDG